MGSRSFPKALEVYIQLNKGAKKTKTWDATTLKQVVILCLNTARRFLRFNSSELFVEEKKNVHPPKRNKIYKQLIEIKGPVERSVKCFSTIIFFLLFKVLSNKYFSLSLFDLKDNTLHKDLYKNQTLSLSTRLVFGELTTSIIPPGLASFCMKAYSVLCLFWEKFFLQKLASVKAVLYFDRWNCFSVKKGFRFL